MEDAKEMLSDSEMKTFAQDEIESGKLKIEKIEEKNKTPQIPSAK